VRSLIQSWYKPRWWTLLLLPISGLFSLIIHLRWLSYRWGIFKIKQFPVPVIVVGNLSVGGTGKTPLVISLIEFFKAEGYRPGVVSRGYLKGRGRKNSMPLFVTSESDPNEVGDEALLIALRTAVPVVVSKNRPQAIEDLLKQTDCNLVISDDGLQHYAMDRDTEIAVLDGKARLGNGFLLPAGPLREPAKRFKRVNFIVTNTGQPHTGEFAMTLKPQLAYKICNPQEQRELKTFVGQTLHAVAGIGYPKRFFKSLRDQNLLIVEHPYPDHYKFKKNDINLILGKSQIY